MDDRKTPENETCEKCQAKDSVRLSLSAIPIGDPVRLGIRTVDDGFREVLSKIHERTPRSNLSNKLSRK